jgi:diguanylate cyclase (GGDEF)-like protein
MNNQLESVSGTTSHVGLLGTSARWLAEHGKLWTTGLVGDSAQDRMLQCLATLGVGLEVWDMHGQRLFTNERIAPAPAPVQNLADAAHHAATPADASGTWRQPIEVAWQNGMGSDADLPVTINPDVPLLQELPGNRWNCIYKAHSPAGYVAIARVDVTDLVRRNQILEERVRELARDSETDALTGLANRRHFDAVFAAELNRATRSQLPISLLMVDIDHFKKYNDHYGHHAGDHCLKQVAAVLQRCVRRAGELVARYGGEEFVLLLPGVDQEEARETAEKCLERMRVAGVPHAATLVVDKRVSLSIGVATLQPQSSLDSVAILNAADAAMYRAKTGGRARYEIADERDWNIADETPRTQPAEL